MFIRSGYLKINEYNLAEVHNLKRNHTDIHVQYSCPSTINMLQFSKTLNFFMFTEFKILFYTKASESHYDLIIS